MLTEEQKTLLEEIFAQRNLTELTLSDTEEISTQSKIPNRAVEYFALEKGICPCRYKRNSGTLQNQGQQKILKSKAVVVGLGGLGGHVAEQLARLGLGEIVGLDPQAFDETNLNRQILSTHQNLGQTKASQAQNRIQSVNNAVDATFYTANFNQAPTSIWKDADLVFDCLDNIDDRFDLAQKCDQLATPMVHGAIAGWYCQVAIVWPGSQTMENIYKHHGVGLEKKVGTPAFTAAIAASLMVTQGIKILTGKCTRQNSELLFFDLLENSYQSGLE